MFDEEPKDIFAGLDSGSPKPPAIPTTPSQSPLTVTSASNLPGYGSQLPPPPAKGNGLKTILLVIVLVIALAAGTGILVYLLVIKPALSLDTSGALNGDPVIVPTSNTNTTGQSNTNTQPTTTPDQPATPTPAGDDPTAFLDSDGDGLTNSEEITVGTSISKADSDSDGLGDREEVKVYQTNPRKSDTDGDGFKDGDEVKNGYNPNGEGKLFSLPTTP